MRNLETVILAGGRGKRLGAVSDEIPKPLVSICGKAIILHIVDYYISNGVDRFIICCGYKHAKLFEFLDTVGKLKCNNNDEVIVDYHGAEIVAKNTGVNTGTGGRIKEIKNMIEGDNFFMTYCDAMADIDLKGLRETHEQSGNIVTLSAVHPISQFGILSIDSNKRIIEFREKERMNDLWINGGFMIMNREIFRYINSLDCSLEKDCFPILTDGCKLGAFMHEGFWQCMDTLSEKESLELALQERIGG